MPPPLPQVPTARLGHQLVRELVTRIGRQALEPLNRALVLRLSEVTEAPRVPDEVVRRYGAACRP